MRRAAWLLGLAAVAAMGLPGCSKSKSASSTAPTVTPASGTVPGPAGASTFTVEIQDVEAVNAPADFPDAVRAGVQLSLDRYLADAVLGPLRSGQPAGPLATVFAEPALERLNGPDRAALIDDGLPKADHVRVDTASAALSGLTGLPVVVAGIHILLTARVGSSPLTLERSGELQLSPEGDVWKVSAYDVRVTRDTSGAAPTTHGSHP